MLMISQESRDVGCTLTLGLLMLIRPDTDKKSETAKNVIGPDSQQGNYYSSRQEAMLTLAIMLKRIRASASVT
jgi:hypothetical protein